MRSTCCFWRITERLRDLASRARPSPHLGGAERPRVCDRKGDGCCARQPGGGAFRRCQQLRPLSFRSCLVNQARRGVESVIAGNGLVKPTKRARARAKIIQMIHAALSSLSSKARESRSSPESARPCPPPRVADLARCRHQSLSEPPRRTTRQSVTRISRGHSQSAATTGLGTPSTRIPAQLPLWCRLLRYASCRPSGMAQW